MIAKSDLIILVVSSSLLGVAIYRWDQNTRNVDTSTVLANTTVSSPASNANSTTADQTLTSTAVTTANSSTNTVGQGVEQPITPTTIVVEDPVRIETATPYFTHTVRSGDSLSEIAARYNTSVNELRSINDINGSTIFIGQEIQYPAN